MKKLLWVAATAVLISVALTGCAGAGSSVSYEAGKTYGKSLTQEAIDVLSDGDINAFCELNADSVDNAGTYDSFSPEDFARGCEEGFAAANG